MRVSLYNSLFTKSKNLCKLDGDDIDDDDDDDYDDDDDDDMACVSVISLTFCCHLPIGAFVVIPYH